MLDIQKRLSPAFYAILSLPSTAMGFALSVQISALSWILGTKYGLEIDKIGLVWAAGPLAGIFGQVIIGLISDEVWFWGGRRRPFILIGGTLAALMLLALPSIDRIGDVLGLGLLPTAIVVALTLDLAINISFNPTRSIITDVTPPGEKRTQGYTWMQTISGFFGVAAYAVGAIWDNYVLIYFGAILLLVLAIFPPFFISEPRELPGAADGKSSAKASFSAILYAIQPLWGYILYAFYFIVLKVMGTEGSDFFNGLIQGASLGLLIIPGFMLFARGKQTFGPYAPGLIDFQKILFAHSFTWIGIQSMFIYMFNYVQDKLPDLDNVDQGRIVSWAFLLFNGVAALLPALVLEPLTRRIGVVRTHWICLAIMALGYAAMFFFGSSAAAIYLLIGICGIGWSATVSLPFSIMSQKIDQSRMGMYMGLFNLAVTLPQLVASLGVGTFVGQSDNKSVLFVICAGCLALSALLWRFVGETEAVKSDGVPAGAH